MKKYFFRLLTYAILAASIATLSALYTGIVKHNKSLKIQVKEQSVIIDSLLKRKTYNFEVKLNVTDKSRNNIYGRYNKGIIEMPNLKTYMLQIDSTNINFK